MGITDLELVLAHGLWDRDTGGRGLSEVFRDTVCALSSADVAYALSGVMAYGLYAPARYTKRIDILAFPDSHKDINDILAGCRLAFRRDVAGRVVFDDPGSGTEVRVRFAEAEPERRAIEDPAHHVVFGLPTRVVKPGYLVWMLCLSDELEDGGLVVELINSGQVEIAGIRQHLEAAPDRRALVRFNVYVAAADRTKSSSYSASVQARLAGRRPGTRPLPG